jgi:hypothetical protein
VYCAGRPGLEPGRSLGQSQLGLPISPSAHQSRPPVPTRVSPGTGGGPQPCTAAKCPRRELNPQHVAPQATASAIGLRGREAATRCRPGSSAVRRRSHSRVQRPSWSPWPRTRNLRGQSPAGLPIPLVTIESDHHAGRSDGDDRLRTQPHTWQFLLGSSARRGHLRFRHLRFGTPPRT